MSALDQIRTIVVVMMENRSFDHLLGWMGLPAYGNRTDVAALTGDLDPNTHELTNAAYDNSALGHRWRPFVPDRDLLLATDVPHSRAAVTTQLAFLDASGGYTMKGFAKAYFDEYPGQRTNRPESMMVFPPSLLPMTSFLVQNFRVCDHWFAPVPADTQPNRFMALAGFTKVDDTGEHPPDHRIVLDWCNERKVRWRVYHEGFSFMAVFRPDVLVNPNFYPFSELAKDFQLEEDETFPNFILVEPTYDDDPFAMYPDDNHPPLPVGPGEAFLSRVYRAVTSNPTRWASTMVVVVYDEHGGFFDHIPPLAITTNPPPGSSYTPFASTGPRVPALVVSPFVTAGSVCKEHFDHTSVLRLVAEKFAPTENGYSDEVVARHSAGRLSSASAALDLVARRTDTPVPPDLGTFLSVGYAEPRPPTTAAQMAFAQARRTANATYPDAVENKHPQMLFHLPHPNTKD